MLNRPNFNRISRLLVLAAVALATPTLAGCRGTAIERIDAQNLEVSQVSQPSRPSQPFATAPVIIATSTLLPVAELVTGDGQPPPTPSPQATTTPTPTTPVVDAVTSPTATAVPPTFTPPPPPPATEGEHFWFQRPVPAGGPIWTDKTYPYGSTRGGTLRPHTGVEFFVPEGTPISAVSSGTVVVAGDDSLSVYGPHPNFYGNLVIIQSDMSAGGRPVYHVYGHLSAVQTAVGDVVTPGQIIGLSGATGVADGPHLHFEVRMGENSYQATRNPVLWLQPIAQTGIVAGRVLWPNGEPAREVPVALVRVDAPSPYTAGTSYAIGEPNPDDILAENIAIDDVIPGYYQVIIGDGIQRTITEMWVFPGRVNFFEAVLNQ